MLALDYCRSGTLTSLDLGLNGSVTLPLAGVWVPLAGVWVPLEGVWAPLVRELRWQRLHLKQCRDTLSDVATLGMLTGLASINLFNAKVFADVAALAKLTGLTELRLSETKVSGDKARLQVLLGERLMHMMLIAITVIKHRRNRKPKGEPVHQ